MKIITSLAGKQPGRMQETGRRALPRAPHGAAAFAALSGGGASRQPYGAGRFAALMARVKHAVGHKRGAEAPMRS